MQKKTYPDLRLGKSPKPGVHSHRTRGSVQPGCAEAVSEIKSIAYSGYRNEYVAHQMSCTENVLKVLAKLPNEEIISNIGCPSLSTKRGLGFGVWGLGFGVW